MSESLIDQYCRIVHGDAEFDDPRLQQLRDRMTDEDRAHVVERLRAEAAASREEARTLREWHQSRKVVPLR
jgi:hypothetical protein